jgi:hypothetical protein
MHSAGPQTTPNGDIPETELGTDKGKPVRKAGTQSYRSKGVTA